MYITLRTVITAGSAASALLLIIGIILKIHKWYLAGEVLREETERIREKHESDMQHIKTENTLVCFALSACLDGLEQLGANHSVTVAKEKLDKYLNRQAHE